jgi:hypothetical protein
MQNTPGNAANILTPLWMVFIATQAVFVFAPWVVPLTTRDFSGADIAVLNTALPLLGLFDYTLSFIVPRKLVAHAAKSFPKGVGALRPSDAEVMKMAAPALIIQYALLEFVTLLGLVHTLVSKNPAAGLPYAALGILGMLMAKPSPDRMRACLERGAAR